MNSLLRKSAAIFALIALLATSFTVFAATTPTIPNSTATIKVGKTVTTLEPNVFPNKDAYEFILEPYAYRSAPDSVTVANNSTVYTAFTVNTMPMPAATTTLETTANGYIRVDETPDKRYAILQIAGLNSTDSDVGTDGLKRTVTSKFTDIPFTQAGVYTYKFTERKAGVTDTAGLYPEDEQAGITYDQDSYYINVYVVNVLDDNNEVVIEDGKPKVTVNGIISWDGATANEVLNIDNPAIIAENPLTQEHKLSNGTIEADGSENFIEYPFENKFSTASLTVSKKVKGALADPYREFSFNISLKQNEATEPDEYIYEYQVYNMGADGAIGTVDAIENSADTPVATTGKSGTAGVPGSITATGLTSGGTFTLKHNEYIKIIGLPDGEQVIVTETGATDYKTNITAKNGTTQANADDTDLADFQGTYTVVDSTADNKRASENPVIIATGATAVNTQEFINNKTMLPPTGVLLTIVPFGILVLLALAAFIFMKKRKTTEE